ncbi:MAG TPA: hypothetical protein VG961_14240 [Ignavibacteria bacterium]|nr:hypothetical protein [Ignavibacteria bacterium]
MKNFYGPFYRSNISDKWHWRKECPDFPVNTETSMISSHPLSVTTICEICMKFEKEENLVEQGIAKNNRYF